MANILKSLAKGLLGIDSGSKDLAKAEEARIRAMQEQNKLSVANETQNVTQFENVAGGTAAEGEGTRRKKTTAGTYAKALNLNI